MGDGAGAATVTHGVETLKMVQDRLGPGEQWARDMSVAQFDADDGYVVKEGIAHEGPWVTHNLGRLRTLGWPAPRQSRSRRSPSRSRNRALAVTR